jgi:hypothetical protein
MNMGVLEVLRSVGPGSGNRIAKMTLGKGPFVAATVAAQLFAVADELRLLLRLFTDTGPVAGLAISLVLVSEARLELGC